MSGSLLLPTLIARQLVEVQPMGLPSGLLFDIMYSTGSAEASVHVPGDGTFCECWGRCYVCHPMTKEEFDAHEINQIEFRKVEIP